MSTSPEGSSSPIRSEFADDPEMVELVAMFVAELGERVERIGAALDAEDWKALSSLAHQLKGAGGGYGFPSISESAARLEGTLKDDQADDLDALRGRVDELIGFCRRATA